MSTRSTRRRTDKPAADTTVEEVADTAPAEPADEEVAEVGQPAEEPTAPAASAAAEGRTRRCYVKGCPRPEVVDGVGLCGAHYALRPDLRKVARHG